MNSLKLSEAHSYHKSSIFMEAISTIQKSTQSLQNSISVYFIFNETVSRDRYKQ